jgi:hypothetical protein
MTTKDTELCFEPSSSLLFSGDLLVGEMERVYCITCWIQAGSTDGKSAVI